MHPFHLELLHLRARVPRVEVYQRLPDGSWRYREVTTGTAELLGGVTIDVAALYVGLPD